MVCQGENNCPLQYITSHNIATTPDFSRLAVPLILLLSMAMHYVKKIHAWLIDILYTISAVLDIPKNPAAHYGIYFGHDTFGAFDARIIALDKPDRTPKLAISCSFEASSVVKT